MIVGAGSGSTIKQFRFDNVHLINSTNSAVASHQFITNTGVATSGGDSIVISNSRFQVSAAGAPFIGVLRFLSSNTALAVDINNTYVESTTGTFPLFLIPASTHANIRISGGNLNSAGSCVSGCIVADNDANSFVNIANTAILPANSTLAFKYGGSSSGNINAMEAVNTGWNGPGGITGTYFIANQGTACANSDFALSAGWGATATVTGVSGQGASCQVTITSAGAGQAANPTVTWTLKNPGPTPAALAKAFMVGGTGTFTTMNNTGLSATAPVFTFNGTPVAASTYIYTFQDGP